MAQSLAQFGQTIKAKHPEYADMSDEDVATKVLAKYPQYKDMVEPQVAGAGPLGTPQPNTPTPQEMGKDMQPSSSLVPAALALGDVAKGAGKGALNTVNGVSSLINKIPVVGETLAPSSGIRAAQIIAQPHNTAQQVGKVGEQAAEFLIPGPAEEAIAAKAAPLVGKALPALKMGLAALGSGTVNAAQGGSFGTGALAGGVGSGVAQGLKAIAPSIAESALNIRKLDRAYKQPQAIGKAVLNETKGFTPGAVADSAEQRLGEIRPQRDQILRTNAIAPVDLGPTRGIISDASNKAATNNSKGAFDQLQPVMDHVSTRFSTGLPIPQFVSPVEAAQLRTGLGDEFVHRWNPDTMTGTKGVAARAYHEIADQIHAAAPGSAELDQRMSNLIPVAKRAESLELNAPTMQKVAGRVAAHTGALTGGVFGAKEGYDRGGIGGGILGAGMGIAAPEFLASPTTQMMLARGLNSGYSPAAIKLLAGAGLQFNRDSK